MRISNRYVFLDGIRGIAAIFVLTRHTTELWGQSFFRSYLAVDLFFMLSGFVIASAYEHKLENETLSAKQFFITRMIRLYPIYAASLLVCAILLLFRIPPGIYSENKTGAIILSLALTGVMLPSRLAGYPSLFPLNGPYWSLFFEVIINLAYALARPILSTRNLSGVIAFFGLLLATAALLRGNLDVGYTWSIGSVAAGLSRAGFGFLLGILIFRKINFLSERFKAIQLPWLATFCIMAILASPSMDRLNPFIDMISVILVFPATVIILSQKNFSKANRLLIALGSASYPIYVLHQPLGFVFSHHVNSQLGIPAPFSGIVFVVAMIALSLALEKTYDVPVRQWLTVRLQYDKKGG